MASNLKHLGLFGKPADVVLPKTAKPSKPARKPKPAKRSPAGDYPVPYTRPEKTSSTPPKSPSPSPKSSSPPESAVASSSLAVDSGTGGGRLLSELYSLVFRKR